MTVRLVPVPSDRLSAWIKRSTEEYAADLVVLGKDPRRALNEAECGMDESFPGGLPLPRHHVLDVYEEPAGIVGYVWIGPSEGGDDHAWWVWDILIEEPLRGRGLGKEAMIAAEEFARAEGATSLGLSVFEFNESAKRLYASLGYEVTGYGVSGDDVTSVKMAKALPSPLGA